MPEFFQKNKSYIFRTLFVIGFVWVSSQLFFEKQSNILLASVTDLLSGKEVTEGQISDLKVVYPDEPRSLEPTLNDPTVRQRLNNVYEPLVRADKDLTMHPALALSWGLVNDTVWDFRLRPDVVFHDGSTFNVEDVVASLNRAMKYGGSQLTTLLSSIRTIEVVDELHFKIYTNEPDPLLLQRLSTVLIIPNEYQEAEEFIPVGTGSYQFVDWQKGDKIFLKEFENYWGPEAKFRTVEMISRPNKNERVSMFLNGEVDFLAFVPFDAVSALEERNFEIKGIPSLEVQFLLFNTQSQLLNDASKRRIVSLAINQGELVRRLGVYAHQINQFVSNGVFGFNPNIPAHKYDIDMATMLADESGLKGKTVTLYLPKGLDVLGEHVRQQLTKIGMLPVISYLDPADFLESLLSGKADIYFLGFRADLGDSADFLDVVIHSDGDFNVGNYRNEKVDMLIDRSLKEMDPSLRLTDLQEVMRIIVEEDMVGIPLFEYDTLYSFSDKLDFDPRIDGLIYFDEIDRK